MSREFIKLLKETYKNEVSETSAPALVIARKQDDLAGKDMERILMDHPEFCPTDRDVDIKCGKIEEHLVCPMTGMTIDLEPENLAERVRARVNDLVFVLIDGDDISLSPQQAAHIKAKYREQLKDRELAFVVLT
ncbi:MAG: hypothetical protein ACOX6N_01440 [Patescibacteria group bacterium]|jgi:hypothetical protein